MADALEDDFVPSDLEDGTAGGEEVANDEGWEERGPLGPKKRKGNETLVFGAGGGEEGEEAKRAKKKQKLKQKDKVKKAKKAAANLALEPGAMSRYPPDMQADHLRKLMRSCKQFAKMTDMELDEVGIAESMLVDTSSSSVERTEKHLAEFVRTVAPKTAESAKNASRQTDKPGEPTIIVVSGNAQRAADLSRAVRPLVVEKEESGKVNDGRSAPTTKKKSASIAVAKLFARHFKIAEQAHFLSKHICPLAVGTPQRLEDLLQHGLSVRKLQCIVLDVSWTDAKQRTLMDGIETRQALFAFLTVPEMQAKLQKDGTKICLF